MQSKRRSIQGKPKIKPFAGLSIHSGDSNLEAESMRRPSPRPLTDALRRILNQKVPQLREAEPFSTWLWRRWSSKP